MARFDAVNYEALTPDNKKLYEAVRGNRPKLVGPFSVLMHNPPLARSINEVVDAIRKDGKLEKRIYELIVLVTARHAGAAYAWAVHEPLGLQAGLTPDVVNAIKDKRAPKFAKDDEKVAYEAASELLSTNKVSDATFQALIKQFGLSEAIEAIACVGLYCMIGGVINTFQVPTANGEKPF